MREHKGRNAGISGKLFAGVRVSTGIVMLGASLLASSAMAASAWTPDKPVELVVPNAPGGGNDRTVRVVQQVIQQKKLVSTPIVAVHKPGGGQAVAYAYVAQRAGDGHYLASATLNLLTNRITGTNPLSYRDLTPVVQLTRYYLSYAVKGDSSIKSFKDVVARLKADPQSVSFASGGGAFASITTGLVALAAGVDPGKLKHVVFRSGGELMAALLGGHVDIAVGAPSSPLAHHKSGAVRIIGVTSPQRIGGAFADVPTLKDHGLDVVSANWYNLVGPPGMSAAQISYWESVFEQVTDSAEWKVEVERNVWDDSFLKSKELLRALQAQEKQIAHVLSTMGLAKTQ